MDDIPKEKLMRVGKILDQKPPQLSRSHPCKDEYWRQFIDALPERIYSNDKIEEFANELYEPIGSPGLTLLVDLGVRGLEYETFIECLKEIKCYEALNLFIQSTIPVITRQPENQSICRGDTLVLSCDAKCDPPPPVYQWYWNETLLSGHNGPELCINGAQINLAGHYRCKVINKNIADSKFNHVWSDIAVVEIVKFPIQEATDHRMEEQVDYFNGTSGAPTGPYSTMSSTDSSLPIDRTMSNTSLGSTSGYSLMSRSGSGSAAATPDGFSRKPIAVSTPVSLPSPSLPARDITITKPLPEKVEWKYRQSFSLECQAKSASGKGMTFTWMLKKKKKVIQVLKKENSPFSSLLTHKWAETDNWKAHDSLLVICEVTHTDESSDEKQESNAKLKVVTVWITEHPKPINGIVNEEAVLSCRAEGKGNITYSLFHSSIKDKLGKRQAHANHCGNFTILLQGTAWGYYTCQADNGDDHATSDSVLVRFGTTRQKRLSITLQPLSMVCEKGKEASLVCRAEPEGCHYQWYFNDSPMISNAEAKTNHLVIPSVNDSHFGRYQCKIEYMGQTQVTNKVSLYPKNLRDSKPRNPTQQNQYYSELAFTTEDDKVKYAREKVALLIGNQEYEHARKLTSPYNDVMKLKETLIKMGFKVFAYFDLQFDETMTVIQKVSELLERGVYLFFYYSGHGFHYPRYSTDYIIPIEAKLDPLTCAHCISSTYITNEFQKTQSKVFAFFDCCRVSFQADKVLGPKTDPLKSEPYNNLLKVLSCSANRSAYEKTSESCSVFNKGLCSGLEKKLNAVTELGAHISEVMQREGQSKEGKEFQRPEIVMKMLPTNITLHEEIMKESWAKPPLESEQYANMYAEPAKLTLPLEPMKAEVSFTFMALNHLKVTTKMVIPVGQCKGMNAELTAIGDGDQFPKKISKAENSGADEVFNVTGIQKFNKQPLKLLIKLNMINSTEQLLETRKEITVPVHEMVYLIDI